MWIILFVFPSSNSATLHRVVLQQIYNGTCTSIKRKLLTTIRCLLQTQDSHTTQFAVDALVFVSQTLGHYDNQGMSSSV